MTPRSHLRPLARVARLAPFGLVLALALAGCSSSGAADGTTSPTGDASTAPSAAPSGEATGPQAGGFDGRSGGGGVSGTIAYVSGQTMQVQDSDSQTAVSWTDTTTIASTVDGTLADVVPGVCVVAVAAGDTGTATSSDGATPSADPAASSGAATRVTITEPVDGACQAVGGFGGAGGDFPGGTDGQAPTDLPSGTPTDLPSGLPTDGSGFPGGADGGTFRAFGGFTSGLVTAVDGSTITVETTAQDGTTSTATATVDGSTTYTRTVAADASAIVVGQCVTARGEADSSGAVAATTLTVTAPVDGACTTFTRGSGGFGGMRGGAGGTAPGGSGTTTNVAPAAALVGATTGGTDA